MCTINKIAHTKNLFNDPRNLIFIDFEHRALLHYIFNKIAVEVGWQ